MEVCAALGLVFECNAVRIIGLLDNRGFAEGTGRPVRRDRIRIIPMSARCIEFRFDMVDQANIKAQVAVRAAM